MHSRTLHGALHEYAEQVAAALSAAIDAGSEVGFEVIPEGGRGSAPALYCYRPLAGEFIAQHGKALRALPARSAALHALAGAENLGAYADCQLKDQRELAIAALDRFAERVFVEGEFKLTPERFEPAYRELEAVVIEGRTEAVLLALLRGITTESEEVPLAAGMVLAPVECLDVLPPDATWSQGGGPALVVVVAAGDHGIARAAGRIRDLQSAMRLFAPGIACEQIGWVRGETGSWRAVPIGSGGHADAKLSIAPGQEDELRAFCSLVGRRRPTEGEAAWALERFEFGLDRENPLLGLSDHLQALRALLEPEGPQSGRLPGRLAVLCAVAEQQDELRKRITQAVALEAAVISGREELSEQSLALAAEVEGHLRALLRDIICGHLQADLLSLADELLLSCVAQEEEEADPSAQELPADVVIAADPQGVLSSSAEPEELTDEVEAIHGWDEIDAAYGDAPPLPQSSVLQQH